MEILRVLEFVEEGQKWNFGIPVDAAVTSPAAAVDENLSSAIDPELYSTTYSFVFYL